MFEPSKILPLKFAAATMGTEKRPRRLFLIAGAALALIVLALGAWLMWGRAGSGAAYLTQPVTIGNVEDSVTALGTIQPLQYVDVGTQVSGQLKALHVDYGAIVKKGNLLAEIDPTIYESRVNADQAQLLNLKAQLIQRQAQKVLADLQFKRQQDLIKENATSQDAFDSADSNLKVAVGQVAALEAQIQQTQSTLKGDLANLGYTKIYAPMAGTVVNLIAKEGQTLNANQTAPLVLRIADLSTMTVWAQVSEADVPKLKIGMKAYFTTLGNSEKRRYGTLRQIIPTPEIVNNVVLYNCLFDVPNSEGDLLTQMSAQVFFVVGDARNVPMVPVSALHAVRGPRPGIERANAQTATPSADNPAGDRPAGDRPAGDRPRRDRAQAQNGERPTPHYTVRVLEDGTPVTRDVEVGVMNRLYAEIKSGLSEGEEVILETPASGMRPNNQQQRAPGGPGGFGGGPRL